MPCGGFLALESRGHNQQWPTSGQIGHITPAAWGVPYAAKHGTKLAVAHKWVDWLHNPCHLGGPQRLGVGGEINSGAHAGRLAT